MYLHSRRTLATELTPAPLCPHCGYSSPTSGIFLIPHPTLISLQAAYLVGVSDPNSQAGQQGLVEPTQFARANQAIQMACQSLGEPGCTQAQVTRGCSHCEQAWERLLSQDRPPPWWEKVQDVQRWVAPQCWPPAHSFSGPLSSLAVFLIIPSATAFTSMTSLWRFELCLLLSL